MLTKKTLRYGEALLTCALIKTRKRITFEIIAQNDRVTNSDEFAILTFKASNGYEVISEHRMDIQSRRIWLLGASKDEPSHRSGSMVFATQAMCNKAFPEFERALEEWAEANKGKVELVSINLVKDEK